MRAVFGIGFAVFVFIVAFSVSPAGAILALILAGIYVARAVAK